MKIKKRFFLPAILTFLFASALSAQDDDLEKLLEQETADAGKEYTIATFKGSRVINAQSVEIPGKNVLQFQILHRFGRLNTGAYQFFGLDQATIRLGFDYGVSERLAFGIGRSSMNKAYDGSVKYKLLRQGANKGMPVTIVWFSNISVNTIERSTEDRPVSFTSRLNYLHQLIIARKFNDRLSLQLLPSFIHRNLVPTPEDQNDVWAAGFAGRYKLTRRVSFNAEYFYLLPGKTADDFRNSFSIGFDLETGGHVFQLHLTNSQGMIDQQFIPMTTGDWAKGDIHFGFNISRVFGMGGKSKPDEKKW